MLPQFISLNAVTKIGPGNKHALGAPTAKFAIQVFSTGAPSAVKVTLRGSLTGNISDFFAIGTWDTGAGQVSGDIVFAVDKPVLFVMAFLETLTGGTNPTVTAYLCGI